MAETTQRPVIYCYDGSEHARNALTTSSHTLGERPAVVVSVHCMRTTAAVWQAILEYAEEVDAELIVAGSRGLSMIESTVLGSVSHGLVNHSHRPVLVVPHKTG